MQPFSIEKQQEQTTYMSYCICSQQIHIDIPRTNPLIPLFQQPLVQEVSVMELNLPLQTTLISNSNF